MSSTVSSGPPSPAIVHATSAQAAPPAQPTLRIHRPHASPRVLSGPSALSVSSFSTSFATAPPQARSVANDGSHSNTSTTYHVRAPTFPPYSSFHTPPSSNEPLPYDDAASPPRTEPVLSHRPSTTPDPPIYQLVYTSSARNRYIPKSQITSILGKSRANNAHCGVTGLLLYRDGSFAQFLEGPQEEVERTFQRIEGDSRHSGVIVVLRRTVERRDFKEWTMGFRDLDWDRKSLRRDDESPVESATGEKDPFAVEERMLDGARDMSTTSVKDLTHPNMSGPIKALIKVFHQNLSRPM